MKNFINDISITCGAYIIFEGEILIVHSTGFPADKWGIPKGLIDPGETPSQTVIREVREETNINIHDHDFDVLDLGCQIYKSKKKILHGFIFSLKRSIQCDIFCKSTYTRDNIIRPEIDAFVWMPLRQGIDMIQPEQKILFGSMIDIYS